MSAADRFAILRRIHEATGSMLAGPPEENGRGSWAEQVQELDSAIDAWDLRAESEMC